MADTQSPTPNLPSIYPASACPCAFCRHQFIFSFPLLSLRRERCCVFLPESAYSEHLGGVGDVLALLICIERPDLQSLSTSSCLTLRIHPPAPPGCREYTYLHKVSKVATRTLKSYTTHTYITAHKPWIEILAASKTRYSSSSAA